MFVYIQSEPRLWTVGHYNPNGDFEPETDWSSAHEAAARVHWLNGGEGAGDDEIAYIAGKRARVLPGVSVEAAQRLGVGEWIPSDVYEMHDLVTFRGKVLEIIE